MPNRRKCLPTVTCRSDSRLHNGGMAIMSPNMSHEPLQIAAWPEIDVLLGRTYLKCVAELDQLRAHRQVLVRRPERRQVTRPERKNYGICIAERDPEPLRSMTDRERGRVAKKQFATAAIYYPDLQTPALGDEPPNPFKDVLDASPEVSTAVHNLLESSSHLLEGGDERLRSGGVVAATLVELGSRPRVAQEPALCVSQDAFRCLPVHLKEPKAPGKV